MRRILSLLIVCLAVVLPVYAQNPIGDTVNKRIEQGKNFFAQGDFEMGASRIAEACEILKSSPDAMPEITSIELAGGTVDALHSRLKRDTGLAAIKIAAAEQKLLNKLVFWDSQNARWHYLRGLTFIVQAGGTPTNKDYVAGDRFTLQQAIKEFDAAMACPNGSSVAADCSAQKAKCQKLFDARVAKGKEIQSRGVREMYKYRGPAQSGGETTSYCSTCHHIHGIGGCSYRSD